MNQDIYVVKLLFRYSERRMVASLGIIQAHLGGDAAAARASASRLSRDGLAYVEGATLRLTLAGLARAVSSPSVRAQTRRSDGRRAA